MDVSSARCRARPGCPAGCEPLGPGAAPRVRSLLPRVRPVAACVGSCVWWPWCLNSSRTQLCLPQHSLRGGCWQVAPRQLDGVSSTNKHARPAPAPRRGELCAASSAYLALLRAAHTRRQRRVMGSFLCAELGLAGNEISETFRKHSLEELSQFTQE